MCVCVSVNTSFVSTAETQSRGGDPVNFFLGGKGDPNGRNQKGREGVSRRKEREGESERTYL